MAVFTPGVFPVGDPKVEAEEVPNPVPLLAPCVPVPVPPAVPCAFPFASGGFCTSESVRIPAAFTWISRHSSLPVIGSM